MAQLMRFLCRRAGNLRAVESLAIKRHVRSSAQHLYGIAIETETTPLQISQLSNVSRGQPLLRYKEWQWAYLIGIDSGSTATKAIYWQTA